MRRTGQTYRPARQHHGRCCLHRNEGDAWSSVSEGALERWFSLKNVGECLNSPPKRRLAHPDVLNTCSFARPSHVALLEVLLQSTRAGLLRALHGQSQMGHWMGHGWPGRVRVPRASSISFRLIARFSFGPDPHTSGTPFLVGLVAWGFDPFLVEGKWEVG